MIISEFNRQSNLKVNDEIIASYKNSESLTGIDISLNISYIINDILNATKLEAHQVTLINRTFDLLELFDDTFEAFGKEAGSEIVLTISIQSQKAIDENEGNFYLWSIGCLLIELHYTGYETEYIQRAWVSFSQGDMSITKKQDGTGLGLSICKCLIEVNGGETNAEIQLGKRCKFWFTWDIELLSATPTISKFPTLSLLELQFNKQIRYALSYIIRRK
ncbi:hypothetical protein C2G38_2245260 [Gigaspora rosea]|uniref:Uncharacterized protein n=1 Tax=Gigaspora rosea TaxID=44941 RepID=A0A397V9Z2_9GLOM|nr:hypothetical protein C2G38_2245260 [Gigaspora rosea]